MRTFIVPALLLGSLCGCGTPGFTVEPVGANPASIVLEYTRWYGGEASAAMSMAEAHCQQHGGHAQLANQQPGATNPYDRIMVTFNCVP